MRKPTTSIQKTQIEKNRENKITIIVGSLLLIAIVSAIIIGVVLTTTIPYSLNILWWVFVTFASCNNVAGYFSCYGAEFWISQRRKSRK